MLKINTPNNDEQVLLHCCCAPCSSAIIECMLANGIKPTVYFFNPNIYPSEEYEIRKKEAIRFMKEKNIDFIDGDYNHEAWLNSVKGMESEPERGGRCLKCFLLRLTETARYASENGFRLLLYTESNKYDFPNPAGARIYTIELKLSLLLIRENIRC